MPDLEDSRRGESLDGGPKADRSEQSLVDQSTVGVANVNDDIFDDGMELVDLSTRYTEEGVLGKGGMSVVSLATDTRLNRKVAIKRILGETVRSRIYVQRFLTVARSIATLNHNNIVQIYDCGCVADGPFLIMECVQGGNLQEICNEAPIELEEAVNIFCQLCDGLAKAHVAGIIHRDIKPANVLMTEDGIPKLTDFNLPKNDTADTGMTMEGAVIGTQGFMPPEQRQASELTDHRSDLWSLAATFYQMVTGKSPKIIKLSDVPSQLQDVLGKALEESKEERFQSALEMKGAVQQAATAGLITARDLGEGECPSCATTNPSDRKFCRNADCAASLEVDCLSCKTGMPMWEVVCGSCGTKQDTLIEKAKEALQVKHDEAETFLDELKFDDALKAAGVIGEQDDFRLQQFAVWHKGFTTRLASSRTSEHARLEILIREVLAHEQAYDYETGLLTLEQVASSLQQTTVSGSEDTVEEITKRLTTKQLRLKELERLVQERVTKREDTGLLQIVDELLTLKPDRPEVWKFKARLEKRAADQVETQGKTAQQLSERQDADSLLAINDVPEEIRNEQLEDLKTKARGLLNQLNNLRDRITIAVSGNQLKDLLPAVEEFLSLKDNQDDLVKLKQELTARETQLDAHNHQIIERAQAHMRLSQFDAAVLILSTIAPEFQSSSTIALSQQAATEKAAAEKATAEKSVAVTAALTESDWNAVLTFESDDSEELRLQVDVETNAADIIKRDPITNAIGMNLELIPAGTFMMGSPEAKEPQYKATISKAFNMQTTEVTQGQWKALMGTEPWESETDEMEGVNYPVVDVSWDEAVEFCKRLSAKEDKEYRLPTEVEWEYACRAGTETRGSLGDNEKAFEDCAGDDENADDLDEQYAKQVGLKKANAFGLYDMHGNVWEWCQDYVGEDYWKQLPEKGSTVPDSGSFHVLRGGSWKLFFSRYSRSAYRGSFKPVGRYFVSVGFRVVCELD
jgi:formylglycine-generating enzyme required for sulfatase activity/tRNA A-37 threonylcarbamoyl transferase component Bud32